MKEVPPPLLCDSGRTLSHSGPSSVFRNMKWEAGWATAKGFCSSEPEAGSELGPRRISYQMF